MENRLFSVPKSRQRPYVLVSAVVGAGSYKTKMFHVKRPIDGLHECTCVMRGEIWIGDLTPAQICNRFIFRLCGFSKMLSWLWDFIKDPNNRTVRAAVAA
jgi:hypothetical protein